jgi:hypothetical protein
MPMLTVETVRIDGVSFVEALLEADAPHRVRLEPRVGGPVWSPRDTEESPFQWGEGTVVVEVGPRTAAVGFATPIEVGDRPLEIVDSAPLSETLPEGITTWIERLEERLAAAESLAAVDDLHAATDAVESIGGLRAVETLTAEIQRDRRLASRLSVVPEDLCDRLESVDVPASAFARIARGG